MTQEGYKSRKEEWAEVSKKEGECVACKNNRKVTVGLSPDGNLYCERHFVS